MIHNISIATADDVIYFGDDVKYIPCILPRANFLPFGDAVSIG